MRFGSTVPLPLPPTLFLLLLLLPPTPPSTMLEAHCFPWGTPSKDEFHNFIIYLLIYFPVCLRQSLDKQPRLLPGISPLPPPAPPSSSLVLFALICPECSANHRKRQFKQICYCCRSHQHFVTNWGIWSQSMASAHTLSDKQNSSVQATRKPQIEGNPCLCSVWWGMTVK